jgi:hypothetical protein
MRSTRRDRDGRDSRDATSDRIVVAAPRPSRRPPPVQRERHAAGASDAGLALIAVVAALAALGLMTGSALGAQAAGALVGGFVGVVAGFAGVYLRYRDL